MAASGPVVIAVAGNQNALWSMKEFWATNQHEDTTDRDNEKATSEDCLSFICRRCYLNFPTRNEFNEHYKKSHSESTALEAMHDILIQELSKPDTHEFNSNTIKCQSQSLTKKPISMNNDTRILQNTSSSGNLIHLNGGTSSKYQISKHNPVLPFACNFCSARFHACQYLKSHILLCHKEECLLTCEKCDNSFNDLVSLHKHINEKFHYAGWYCLPCNILLQNLRDFIQHQCRFKSQGATTWINLKLVLGTEEKAWQCHICFQIFFGFNVFEKHIRNCALICMCCSEKFIVLNEFLEHEQSCLLKISTLPNKNVDPVFLTGKKCSETLTSGINLCKYCNQVIGRTSTGVKDHKLCCAKADSFIKNICIYCNVSFADTNTFFCHFQGCTQKYLKRCTILDEKSGKFYIFCSKCQKAFTERDTGAFFLHSNNCLQNRQISQNIVLSPLQNRRKCSSQNTRISEPTVSNLQPPNVQNIYWKKLLLDSSPVNECPNFIPVESYSLVSHGSMDSQKLKSTGNYHNEANSNAHDECNGVQNKHGEKYPGCNDASSGEKKNSSNDSVSLNKKLTAITFNTLQQNNCDNRRNKDKVSWGKCNNCAVNFVPIKDGICTLCHFKTPNLLQKNLSLRKMPLASDWNTESLKQEISNSQTVNSNSALNSDKDCIYSNKKNVCSKTDNNKNESDKDFIMDDGEKSAIINSYSVCNVCGHKFCSEKFENHPCTLLLKYMSSCYVKIERCKVDAAMIPSRPLYSLDRLRSLKSKDENCHDSFICKYCTVSFDKKADFENHVCFLSDKELMSILKSCSIIKRDRKFIEMESKSMHEEEIPISRMETTEDSTNLPLQNIFQCSRCEAVLPNANLLEWHLRTHDEYRPHVCPVCHSRFKRLSNLKEHWRFFHLKGRVPCMKCDQVFATSTKLREHSRIHTTHYKWVKRRVKNRLLPYDAMLTSPESLTPQRRGPLPSQALSWTGTVYLPGYTASASCQPAGAREVASHIFAQI